MSTLDAALVGGVAFVGAALAAILAITLVNLATASRLLAGRTVDAGVVGRVSVLIPARDEAATIGTTLDELLRQEPPPLEVIVLDDGSTDGTADAALAAAARAAAVGAPGAGRLRVVAGEAPPAGWAGKPWACRRLGREARGDLLLFTDADTRWAPGALAALVAEAERTGADLLSAWPTQTTLTWGERLTVPLMALAVMAYLPWPLVHGTARPSLAAANGQCLLFRRGAYEAIGGHEAVASAVLDDVILARRVKAAGGRLRMTDGGGLVGCRMYDGWAAARDGFGKNILAGYGTLAGLALGTVFHWLVFLGPWAWLLAGAFVPDRGGALSGTWPLVPLALALLGIVPRALTAAVTRQRVADAFLMPVSTVLMTLVALRAAGWALTGGARWKGRVVPR